MELGNLSILKQQTSQRQLILESHRQTLPPIPKHKSYRPEKQQHQRRMHGRFVELAQPEVNKPDQQPVNPQINIRTLRLFLKTPPHQSPLLIDHLQISF